MVAARIFLCHNVDEGAQRETQILNQLRNRIQESGAEVVIYPGHPADEGFVPFLNQYLPTCQWFVLFQTPAAIHDYQVRMATNTALKLVEQKHMQGILRIVATPSEPQDVPPEWTSIQTFDATFDYPRALEKLLLTLSINRPAAGAAMLAPPPVQHFNPVALSSYDRPPVASSRLSRTTAAVQNTLTNNRRLVAILSILLVMALLASLLSFTLLNRPQTAKTKPPVAAPINYGHIYFYSSGDTGVDNTTGIADGVQVNLPNLPPLATGNAYYAWLLPDKSNFEGPPVLLGHFVPSKKGGAYITYVSPQHQNLLTMDSRFAVTDESSATIPDSPTADKSKWIYYAEVPQVANPNDPDHYSDLDHLRHLLSDVSMGSMGGGMMTLKGGLSIWFYQNTRKVFEWASAARGTGDPRGASLMRNQFVRILDYLDGSGPVHMDVPPHTPVMADPTASQVPLLSVDPTMADSGYIHEIETHLLGLSDSPHATQAQQTLAGQIDAALNTTKAELELVRQDAMQLVQMSNQQLLDPATVSLLDDLVNHATNAFIGTVNPTTGVRVGGATWIFDRIPGLAQLTVEPYKQ